MVLCLSLPLARTISLHASRLARPPPAVALPRLNGDVGEAFVTQDHCAGSIKLKKSLAVRDSRAPNGVKVCCNLTTGFRWMR
jgi:hypothetical protein